jgi:pimeloyl-ACP methyl ester carboxylesterase
MKKFFISSIILSIFFTPCSFTTFKVNITQAAYQIPSVEIYEDEIWTSADNPYVFTLSDIHIHSGATLTLEQGVIMKMADISISIEGALVADGAENSPVVFTSNSDNNYGGDTNPDNNYPPHSGDWEGIRVKPGGKLILNHAIVQYGGYGTAAISVEGGEDDIDNSTLTKNNIGIAVHNGMAIIHNSKIYNNNLGGIINETAEQINATDNWWGDNSGPYHETLNPQGKGEIIAGDILFDPWIGKAKKKDPVIIVPGIMGSWNVSGKWELDPILHTYDNLWEALKSAGYEENKTLFAFPYQWRLPNSYTAILLKDKIQEVKNICQCDQVDLITHSMGGLAARAYIQSNDYQNDVDQLIFLGTPHKGSTRAYLAWEGGEFGIKPIDKIQQRIFTLEADFNGYGSVFKYVRGLPMQSVQELLPIYDYLRDKNTMRLRAYPNNYPVNTFLELLNNQSQLEKLNNINITNILADAGSDSTINNLRVVEKEFVEGEWEHGYPEHYSLPFTDHGLEYSAGDGTVPERGNKDFAGLENAVIDSSHNNMATDAQKMVIKELTGVEPTQEIRKNIFSKFLLIRIFSPADFTVIAPNGSKIGKNIGDSATIESAFYSGFDSDIEFAVIPDPIEGEYKIELQGTGEGEYKLSVSYIDDEQDVDKDFVGKIQIGQTKDFTIIYSEQAEGNPISDLATIDSTIADIEEMYNKGWITKKSDKNLLIHRLKYLEKILEHFDKQIERMEKLIQQAQDNEKLKPKAKEKILQALNKRIEEIEQQRQKAIERNLDWLERKLDAIKRKGGINQQGYDIIISDINYLRNNL